MVDCPESGDCPTLDESNLVDWKNPREAEPPESFTIVLLDFSGSMNFKDTDGTPKLSGAINAIKQFNRELRKRSGNKSHIAIVPFGRTGGWVYRRTRRLSSHRRRTRQLFVGGGCQIK